MKGDVIVNVNGVTQGLTEFRIEGHDIVFSRAPAQGDNVKLTMERGAGVNSTSYVANGRQSRFHLPAVPRGKFDVIENHTESVPDGYTVVDVDTEIDLWIRENCPPSDWKWADQLVDDAEFGMTRLIVRDSVATFIGVKWS